MKWFKRILLAVALLVTAGIVVAAIGVHRYRSMPSWYHPRNRPDANAIAQTGPGSPADHVHQLTGSLVTWAAEVQAANVRHRHSTALVSQSTPDPADSFSFSLSNEEFASLLETFGFFESRSGQKIQKYLADPQVFFIDDGIALVGRPPDNQALVSFIFRPSIDSDGKLLLPLSDVMAGTLSLPSSMTSGKLQQLKQMLGDKTSQWQSAATVDQFDVANKYEVASATSLLLQNAISSLPSDPYLFIPFDLQHPDSALMVRITAIKAIEDQLKVTLHSLTDADRKAVAATLK